MPGCDALRDATRGCRVIVLAATEAEAEPLRAAMLKPERHTVATKTIYVGGFEAKAPDSPVNGIPPDGARWMVRAVLAITGCDKANTAHLLTCLLQAMTPAPLLVLQVGIAGAFLGGGPGPGATVGDIVIATRETYSDVGSSSPVGWYTAAELDLPIACVNGIETGGVFPLDAALVLSAADAISEVDWTDIIPADSTPSLENVTWPLGVRPPGAMPAVLLGPCITSSRVTGIRSEGEVLAQSFGALAESMEGAAAAHVCALYGVPFLELRGISNLVGDRDRDGWRVERAVAVAGRAAMAVVAELGTLPLAGAGRGAGAQPGTGTHSGDAGAAGGVAAAGGGPDLGEVGLGG